MSSNRREFLRSSAALGALSLAGASSALTGCQNSEGAEPTQTARSQSIESVETRFDPWIEVDGEAMAHNLREVRRLSGNRPVLAVVKNNGYGIGTTLASQILEPLEGVDGFAVVKASAAIALREAGITKPIHLMAMVSESLAPELAHYDIIPSLYSANASAIVAEMATRKQGPIRASVYVDTGMSRMGIPFRDGLPWIEELINSNPVTIDGVFTGFTEDAEFDREQLRRLLSLADAAEEAGIEVGRRHAASSSAVFEFPEAHLDMVRPGMALYGGYPNDPALQREKAELLPAFALKARVVRTQRLEAGDSVSYGRNYIASQPTWVATLPVGHTDGYPRTAVDGARVAIGTETYPVIGAVSASHTVIEIGAQQQVSVGDVATLLGSEPGPIEANRASTAIGRSIYDTFMHLNPSIPRITV